MNRENGVGSRESGEESRESRVGNGGQGATSGIGSLSGVVP